MSTSLRHLRSRIAPHAEQLREDEQQSMPIFDAIAKAVKYWNILGLKEQNDFTHEDTVIRLLQSLHKAYDLPSTESLVLHVFADKQGSSQFAPDQALMMQFLADDVWSAWTAYLERRNAQSAFTQETHARSRMRRFYHPMTKSR